jgi:hypothetical protein
VAVVGKGRPAGVSSATISLIPLRKSFIRVIQFLIEQQRCKSLMARLHLAWLYGQQHLRIIGCTMIGRSAGLSWSAPDNKELYLMRSLA